MVKTPVRIDVVAEAEFSILVERPVRIDAVSEAEFPICWFEFPEDVSISPSANRGNEQHKSPVNIIMLIFTIRPLLYDCIKREGPANPQD